MNISQLQPRAAALMGYGVMLTKQYDPTDLPPASSNSYSRGHKANKKLTSDQKIEELLSRLPDTFGQKEMVDANKLMPKLFSETSLCKLMGSSEKFVSFVHGKFKRRIYTKKSAYRKGDLS